MADRKREPSPSTSSGSTLSSSSSSDDDSSSSSEVEPESRGGGASSSSSASGVNHIFVRNNPDLRFEKPDNEYIPLPPVRDEQQRSRILRTFVLDRTLYPDCRYRMIDFFRAAVEMFLQQVRTEFKEQAYSARRNGKELLRFVWKNKGELAITFACSCDMLKLLYDSIKPGPVKPLWDAFVRQFTLFAIVESGVPASVLPEQTYHIKYMDWQKGGTRYTGDSSNVRFPSAQERRLKVETFIRSGQGYRLESVMIESTPVAASAPRRPIATTAPPAMLEAKSAAAPLALAHGDRPAGPGPARTPARGGAAHAPGKIAMKNMPEEMRHLYWLSLLARVKGGAPAAAFPDERAAAVPGLVRTVEITDNTQEMALLLNVIAASSTIIQMLFEAQGGVVALRRFAAEVAKKDFAALRQVVDCLVKMKTPTWSVVSQHAWRTNLQQQVTPDLRWLRALPVVPEASQDAWGALILVLEERYILRDFTANRQTPKRPRQLEDSALNKIIRRDNIDMQRWKLPRVNTFCVSRLPFELRAPPCATDMESATIEFINKKKQFTDELQTAWQSALQKRLAEQNPSGAPHAIPLFYDPFQVLGVERGDME